MRIVAVTWLDSRQPMPEWVWADDVANFEWSPVICSSVGFEVDANDEVIVLAQNIGDVSEEGPKQLSGLVQIPKRSVIRTTYIGSTDGEIGSP